MGGIKEVSNILNYRQINIREGITFDDVLLVPKKGILPSRKLADTSTYITKTIRLNIPLISSNMATVTEARMAIAMARNGGLGVIHQFITAEQEAEEVKKVKRSTSYFVENPICVQEGTNLRQAKEIMKRYHITSLMIINPESKLVGILTSRDYQFEKNDNILIDDLMTRINDLVVAHEGISFEDAHKILKKSKIEKLPLIDNKGFLKGLATAMDIKTLEKYPNATRDNKGRLRVGAAVGVKGNFLKRVELLIENNADLIIVDSAHGHSDAAINAIKEIKLNFPETEIMAGNVATSKGTEDLINAGADSIKVGIGPGSACTTRIVAGAGVPQLTAIFDCVSIADQYDIPIIADGGTRYPADLSKVIAAGASAIMAGRLFAGTMESPGQIIIKSGRRYKEFRGSASYDNNLITKSILEKKKIDFVDVIPEGVESLIEYKGSVSSIINELIGGLKSGISYSGSTNMKEMQENAEFIKITSAGIKESHVHDLDRMKGGN